jgi:hypothetical protein
MGRVFNGAQQIKMFFLSPPTLRGNRGHHAQALFLDVAISQARGTPPPRIPLEEYRGTMFEDSSRKDHLTTFGKKEKVHPGIRVGNFHCLFRSETAAFVELSGPVSFPIHSHVEDLVKF